MNRRSLITGLISLGVAAPAIVKAASLMPVRKVVFDMSKGVNFQMGFQVYINGQWVPMAVRELKLPLLGEPTIPIFGTLELLPAGNLMEVS